MLKGLWKALREISMKEFEGRNYINGEWRATAEMYANLNPATGEKLGNFPSSGPSEVSKAVLSARKAFRKWRKVSRFVRSDYMNKIAQLIEERKDDLAKVISLETVINYN